MAYQTDTPSFINAVELLLSQSDRPDRLFRLSKPLSLFVPTILYATFSIPIAYSFWIQQLIAYWFGAFFLYKILEEVVPDSNAAYLGMLAYILCQPMAVYGLAMLTDGLGWCWLIIGVWLSIRSIRSSLMQYTQLIGLGIFIGFGFFIKESVVMVGIFTFFLLLLNPSYSISKKIFAYSILGISFLTIFLIGNLFTYLLWQESIFQWIHFGQSAPPPFNLAGLITQSYHTLDLYWFLFVIGFIKSIHSRTIIYPLNVFLLTIIASWLTLPFVWPYLYDRILFMITPFMMVWIAVGALQFRQFSIVLVVFGGIANLLVSFCIYRYQSSNLIESAAFFYGILLLLFGSYNKYSCQNS